MVALEEGPFYAVETVPYAYTGSTGGVRVDGNGQLLTEDGVSIEGLYLARRNSRTHLYFRQRDLRRHQSRHGRHLGSECG